MSVSLFAVILLSQCVVAKAEWMLSKNLSMWYPDWEICAIQNNSAFDMKSWKHVTKYCNITTNINLCFAGGQYQHHYCHNGRNLSSFVSSSYDNDVDSTNYVLKLIDEVGKRNGSIYFDGDSQMTNFRQGVYCDLYRQKLQKLDWNRELHTIDSGSKKVGFTSTVHTDISVSHNASAAFRQVENHIASRFDAGFSYVLLIVGLGTHYNEGRHASEGKAVYRKRLELMLPFWNSIPERFSNYTVHVAFTETPPQHWESKNGYWARAKSKCVPVRDPSPDLDWRNSILRDVVKTLDLRQISIISTRYLIDLYSEHCLGDFNDCTHYAYWPMLYQPIYRQIYDIVRVR